MKPILLSIKPPNNFSPDSFKFFNPTNLVKSIGIGPRKEIKDMSTRSNLFFQNKPEKLL